MKTVTTAAMIFRAVFLVSGQRINNFLLLFVKNVDIPYFRNDLDGQRLQVYHILLPAAKILQNCKVKK